MIRFSFFVALFFLAPLAVVSITTAQTASTTRLSETRPDPRFETELAAAEKAAEGRECAAHLRKALAYRPNHRDNIAIEFRMGIELSQRPESDESTRQEAREVFEHIVTTYHHMDYYSQSPDHAFELRMLMPQAAMHAAENQTDNAKAREYLLIALKLLNETCQQRAKDWMIIPPEPDEIYFRDNELEQGKRIQRAEFYQQRKKNAISGEVLSPYELGTAEAVVRQFVRIPRDGSDSALQEIIRTYPGTPMARIAAEMQMKTK